MTLLSRTLKALRELGVRPSRKLGQNFLVDEKVLRVIVEAAELSSGDTVLEIGAGTGNLTMELAKRCGKVIAVEIDKRLAEYLKRLFAGYSNVEIVCGDFLEMEFPTVTKVVSNIPYSISSKIIERLALNSAKYSMAVLTVQEEFARRLVAEPGSKDYGRLTVLARLFFERVEVVARVSSRSFYPPPEVDSAIVKIVPRAAPPKDSFDILALAKHIFTQPNKTLRACLRNLSKSGAVTIERDVPDNLLRKRVRELSIDDLRELLEFVKPCKQGDV